MLMLMLTLVLMLEVKVGVCCCLPVTRLSSVFQVSQRSAALQNPRSDDLDSASFCPRKLLSQVYKSVYTCMEEHIFEVYENELSYFQNQTEFYLLSSVMTARFTEE